MLISQNNIENMMGNSKRHKFKRVFLESFLSIIRKFYLPRTESILNRGVRESLYVYQSGPSSKIRSSN